MDIDEAMVRAKGDVLTARLGELKWRQKNLARPGELSLRTISTAVNSGEITLRYLRLIADLLGLPVTELTDDPRAAALTESDAEAKFNGSKGRGSSQCCAFLAGDFSVLKTKRAVVIPIGAGVRVAVSAPADGATSVRAYEKQEQWWMLNCDYAAEMRAAVNAAFESSRFRKEFGWVSLANGLEITAFSDVSWGAGVHEDTAFALGLAAALQHLDARANREETLKLAGAILCHWYEYSSWSGLVCGAGAVQGQAIFFDRKKDEDIDLVGLLCDGRRHKDFFRNAYLSTDCWSSEPLDIDLARFSVWLQEESTETGPTDRTRYRPCIAALNDKLSKMIIDKVYATLSIGGEDYMWHTGLLMRMHHEALALAGFIDRDFDDLVSRVIGLPGVLGAKSAIGRGSGAIVMLVDNDREAEVFTRMRDLGWKRLDVESFGPHGTIRGGFFHGPVPEDQALRARNSA